MKNNVRTKSHLIPTVYFVEKGEHQRCNKLDQLALSTKDLVACKKKGQKNLPLRRAGIDM